MKLRIQFLTINIIFIVLVPLLISIAMENRMVLIGLAFPQILWLLWRTRTARHLPGASYYNPLGFIEIHIERTAKKNPYRFYRYALKTVEIAKKEHKDVLFFTWHVSAEKLKELFGGAIEIYKPSLLDRFYLLAPFVLRVIPIPLPNPYIKCYIETDKLSDEILRNHRINRMNKGGESQ